MTTSLQTEAIRKKHVRFGEGSDLQLLREVISKNPFRSRGKWAEISDAMPLDVDARRVRERTLLLMSQHKAKNAESKKKSGVDEVYGEKEQLLDELLELAEEEENSKKEEKEKAKEYEQAGKNIRKRAMDNLSKSDDESTPIKKSSSKDNILLYLREKNELENKTKEKEIEIKKKELELKEREMVLQRERFEMDRTERKQQSDIMAQLLKALLEDLLNIYFV